MTNVFVYILKSEKNGRFYIGSTINLLRRLNDHAEGKAKYTRNNRPLFLAFSQEFMDLKTARKVEFKLKKLASRSIIEKIISEGKISLGL